MKTVFDLRGEEDDEIYGALRNFYDEPLNFVRLGEQSI